MPGSGLRRQLAVKRAMDISMSAAGLVLLSPIVGLTALALLTVQGRPILFRQVRPGTNGEPFTIVKFRTMRATRPGEVSYRTDEQRVTRLGRALRTSSLDELPELWNVLRGEMSLVGPRPLLVEYLASYTPQQRRRHDMRPGFTSWAAVKGRHILRFDERIELDVWYVEHWSLRLDLRILAMTARQVLSRTHVVPTQDPIEIGFPLPGVAGGPGGQADVETKDISPTGR